MAKPHDVPGRHAERALLGTLLRFPGAIADVAPLLHDDSFSHAGHLLVWNAMKVIWDQGLGVDLPALAHYLQDKGHLGDLRGGDAGQGATWLAELADSGSFSPHKALYYAELVDDAALRRRLASFAAGVLSKCQSPTGPARDMLRESERELFRLAEMGVLGQTVDMPAVLKRAWQRIESAGTAADGIPTGLWNLDNLTGGLHNAELVIVAARPSVGKTALGMGLALHAALYHQINVYVASLEQSVEELGTRLLCGYANVNAHRVRSGSISGEDAARLSAACQDLEKAGLWVDDAPTQDMLRIASNARRCKASHQIGLVIVDYLQLVEPDPDTKRETRQEKVAQIARRLKALARELQVPVVALAQLNREVEQGGGKVKRKPRLADIRESGAVEQAADTVLLLHRPDEDRKDDPERIELLVAKQRNGPTGEVDLLFHRKYTKFTAPAGSPFDDTEVPG